MNYAEIISNIRDQRDLSPQDIQHVVSGITTNEMGDAQVGAFAMAVLWRGLSDENLVAMTKAMRDSGDILTWDVDGAIVDKHSTGGVGDCVSLALAPILACAGLFVPMISGRGLGHTGGTLDKLESMSGFNIHLSQSAMQAQLRDIGCVMAGQSAKIAPADKRLYAIRDVTGTVPSIDLITASILSKKLAAGLEHLVLDVKCGLGAFMKTKAEAEALTQKLVDVAIGAGCQTSALITDMNLPLCSAAGNALEVEEIIQLLEGRLMNSRLYEVTKALCAQVMTSAGVAEAADRVDEIVSSGHALERFEKMVFAQGGPKGMAAIRADIKPAPVIQEFVAPSNEVFYGFDAYEVGMSVVDLGGGRKDTEDAIDPRVGISDIQTPKPVQKGEVLARIHAKDEASCELARERLKMGLLKRRLESELIMERVI